jgi:DNA-binding response OmpR family regulator
MTEADARILVVDDDEDIRELLKIFLEADGYRVRQAADGIEAWQQLQNGDRPALILLDLMMPRMDGEQFLKKMRCSTFAKTPVIILSADEATCEKTALLKASYCLKKPIELDELLRAIKRFMPG